METAKVLEWGDYLVITLTIAISVGIGIYYRFAGDRQKTSETSLTIFAAVGGPLLGLFTLGMLFESANQRGAVLGSALSLMFSLWISFGSPRPVAQGLPVSIEGCSNETRSFLYKKLEMEHITLQEYLHPPIPDKSKFLYLYRISYMWIGPIGFFITIVIGLVTSNLSQFFGFESPKNINPDLFFPFIAKRIRKRLQTDNGLTAHKYEFKNKTRCNTATTHM
ncbi:hypothetical protein G9C98_000391 [Cotesia typhae]|uniref:Uncharacterized protein n=1 Tax=Cotesia typhae TaxID=2053667 RepID=A0A8J5USH9_9HYME|nr:hypothetical protein G9C98_000391 [Cotesia typhae]